MQIKIIYVIKKPTNYFAEKSYEKGMGMLRNLKYTSTSIKSYSNLLRGNPIIKDTVKKTIYSGIISETAKSLEDGIGAGTASVVNQIITEPYKNSFVKEVPHKVFK